MQTIKCLKKCCSLNYIPYKEVLILNGPRPFSKAGIFITDESGKILLVQSKGNLWGCPKGTMKKGENSIDCAIREVKEETGLDIDCEILKHSPSYFIYKNKTTYYSIIIPNQKLFIQNHIPDNDANGIGWIKVECLREMVENKKIFINQHCRLVLENFLNLEIRPRN